MEGMDPSDFSSRRSTDTHDLEFAFDFNAKHFELLFEIKVSLL